jgi:hypothetical protein
MLSLSQDSPSTYRRMLAIYGGDMGEAFALAVQKILRRHFGQNGGPTPPDAALLAFARALWQIALKHGLPAPLKGADQGACADLPDAEADRLAAPAVSNFPILDARPSLANAARELLRGVIQPEFKKCRLSYKEAAPDTGACERQRLDVARARPSGAHCADCPYWTQLSAEKNEKLLLKEWDPARAAELAANLSVFLPEDFRALRQLLHLHARHGRAA